MIIEQATHVPRQVLDEALSLGYTARTGLIMIQPPGRLLKLVWAYQRYGLIGATVVLAGERYGDRPAIIDERGTLSYRGLDRNSNALAGAWRARGLGPGEGVAIMARNHRGLLEALFAAAKCGARIILMNTDFSGPQLQEVGRREGADLYVVDEEFLPLTAGLDARRGIWRAWADTPGQDTIDSLIAATEACAPPRPGTTATLVLLTSGTTGTPKGAPRSELRTLTPVGAIFSRVPFRIRGVTECAAPIFHALGVVHAVLAVALGCTLILRRHFDAAATLESLAKNRVSALIVVPVMLRRMLDLGPAARESLDLSALRIIFVGGSQLGADLCVRGTDAFGPVLYNLYGSTEVAFASIATPRDLAAAPGCVGRVASGAIVRLLDDAGDPVPAGACGRIFVGNAAQFQGYTGGGTKQTIGRLMSSGDLGHFDKAGRLFIDGRADDMIVSGGENVFPGEVEELLAAHPAVREAAVVGVPDEQFGQRLRAFVVRRSGRQLSPDEVRQHVKANLARYKVPRDVVFLDELPRNPTGKVLKRVLAADEPTAAGPATGATLRVAP